MQHGGDKGRDGGSGWYPRGRLLESGPSGELYETIHPRLPGACAIRILPPALTDRMDALPVFRAEVAKIAALRHPNILQVVEVGSRPDVPAFIVTERLDGETLRERLGRGGRVPLKQVVKIIKGVAAGLKAAHHAGVVHGELNPGAIFLARSEGYEHGLVKLLDFGIGRLREIDAIASLPLETIRFLAPEQASGRADEVDGRADQFALASIAYLMLAGRPAFSGDSPVDLLYQIVHGKPAAEPILEGGDAVEVVIRRGLASSRADRFETIGDFAQAFTVSAGEEHRPTPPPSEIPAVIRLPTPHIVTALPAANPDTELFTHPFFTPEPDVAPRRRRRPVILVRRRPSRAGRWLLVGVGLAAAWLAGASAFGWRPPLSWRQTKLWHELRLPHAE